MAGVLKAWGDTSRRVVAADSFSGLPPPDDRFPKDGLTAFDFHLRPELAINAKEVRSNFERYQLWNPQVVILEGLFRDTLPRYPYGPISVLRMDGDLYSSTMDTLENLYDLVSDGGCVISDDYGVVIDARRAVLDFRASHKTLEKMWRIDGDGIFWTRDQM
jgi:O-methyltransferase